MEIHVVDDPAEIEETIESFSEEDQWNLVLVEDNPNNKKQALISSMASGRSLGAFPEEIDRVLREITDDDSIIVRMDTWRWSCTKPDLLENRHYVNEARTLAAQAMKKIEGTKRTHVVSPILAEIVSIIEYIETESERLLEIISELSEAAVDRNPKNDDIDDEEDAQEGQHGI